MAENYFFIDLDRCVGCLACEPACKEENDFWGIRIVAVGPKKCKFIPMFTEECTRCKDRVDKGLKPSCVMVCPTKAIYFDDEDKIMQMISKKMPFYLCGTKYPVR